MDVQVKMGRMDWIDMDKVKESWRAFVKAVINLRAP
jgi:hypothetical protein